ncbi:MAG: hypothetical protein IMW89_13440 [Ktedonobacteraceae bacterium]|nr:hypothetical protein [Ktedonobacteraceae bacterium]MBE3560207.1 hypothetical protein [Ktedonobacteraceae bacterium]
MSEVAQLMRRIEEECQAMQNGLSGYAISSPHEYIQHRYMSIEAIQRRLAEIVGEQEAMEWTFETYKKVMG